jgi:plastocyanin
MRRVLALLALAAPAVLALPAEASGPAIEFGGSHGLVYVPSAVRVPVHGTVTWTGDFGTHPLRSASGEIGNDGPVGTTGSYSHDFAAAGVYSFYCAVHGPFGMTGKVTVTNNQPPVAAFTPAAAVVDSGTRVTFDASSSTDDGAIARYEWDLDGDGFDDGTGVTASRTFTGAAAATTYTVRLRVTDDNADAVGPESTVVAHDVTVHGAQPAPTPTPMPAQAPHNHDPSGIVAPTPSLLGSRLAVRGQRILVRLRAADVARARLTLRAAGRTLAAGSGAVGPTARVLRLKLTAAGRQRLRAHRTIHAVLTVRVLGAGGARRITRAVTIRR